METPKVNKNKYKLAEKISIPRFLVLKLMILYLNNIKMILI